MRRLSLPALALSLVLVGCGPKDDSGALPKTETADGKGSNITSTEPKASTEVVSKDPAKPTPDVKAVEPTKEPIKGPVASNDTPAPKDLTTSPNFDELNQQRPDLETVKKLKKKFDEEFGESERGMLIAAKGNAGWRPSTIKPEDVINQMEERLAMSKNISGESRIQFNLNGTRGLNLSNLAIDTPRRFYVEYPRITLAPRIDVQKEVLVGDGHSYATNALVKSGWSASKPISALKLEDRTTLADWTTQFPRKIYSTLQGGKPFSQILAQARKEGMDVVTEEAIKRNQAGQEVRQLRVVMMRKPSDTIKKGVTAFEVVVDAYRQLPMHVRANLAPPKVGEEEPSRTLVWWMARWNLDPKQKLAVEDFVIPGKAAQRMVGQ